MITHPEKLLFPSDGISKGEVAAYYATVAPVMLPHLRGRPVTLERFPAGIEKKGFMQKDVVKGFPEWLPRVARAGPDICCLSRRWQWPRKSHSATRKLSLRCSATWPPRVS